MTNDIKAHKYIDQVNILERALSYVDGKQRVLIERRIKVLDQRAWNLSSDDSEQCDYCGNVGALNRVTGLCAGCTKTMEKQHG